MPNNEFNNRFALNKAEFERLVKLYPNGFKAYNTQFEPNKGEIRHVIDKVCNGEFMVSVYSDPETLSNITDRYLLNIGG